MNVHFRCINLTFKRLDRQQNATIIAVQRVYTFDSYKLALGFTARDEYSSRWRLQPYI